MTGLRIAYAGTPEFAVPALQALLHSKHQVKFVVTQPDRPAGRGRKLTPSPVKLVAEKGNVPILQPKDVNTAGFVANLQKLNIDMLVVAAFGQLFSTDLLAAPAYGCINIHASLLPRWRGASPIQHAILAGDACAGITIMQMGRRMDAGEIWLQSSCDILPEDTAQSLHDRLANMSGKVLLDAIELITSRKAVPLPQNDAAASYCKKLHKHDGLIDWQENADSIVRKVRAYYPWPGAYTSLHKRRLVITKASAENTAEDSAGKSAGTVMQADKSGILVSAAAGAVRIQELIPAGGKRMSAAEFNNSNHTLQVVLGAPSQTS